MPAVSARSRLRPCRSARARPNQPKSLALHLVGFNHRDAPFALCGTARTLGCGRATFAPAHSAPEAACKGTPTLQPAVRQHSRAAGRGEQGGQSPPGFRSRVQQQQGMCARKHTSLSGTVLHQHERLAARPRPTRPRIPLVAFLRSSPWSALLGFRTGARVRFELGFRVRFEVGSRAQSAQQRRLNRPPGHTATRRGYSTFGERTAFYRQTVHELIVKQGAPGRVELVSAQGVCSWSAPCALVRGRAALVCGNGASMGSVRQWGVPEVGATVQEELSQRSPNGPV
jgi:hypothetical protein